MNGSGPDRNSSEMNQGQSSASLTGRPGRQPQVPQASNLRAQTRQLERLLLEQQANLRTLEHQQNVTTAFVTTDPALQPSTDPGFMMESLQDLREKLQLLQTLNQLNHQAQSGQSQDFSTILNQQEILNNLRQHQQNSYRNPAPDSSQSMQRGQQELIHQLRGDNSKLRSSLVAQQEQIHQLTQSLNHCFQAVLTIQRDVSSLQQTVVAQNQQQQNARSRNDNQENDDNLDSISQHHQQDFESHSSASWAYDFHHHQQPVQGKD